MSLFDVFRRGSKTPEGKRIKTADYSGSSRRKNPRADPRPGTRILLIDDSPKIIARLKKELGEERYLITEAHDGRAALRQIEMFEPELIFLDVILPDTDGFSLLRLLREMPHTRDIPIIVTSGNPKPTEQMYVQRLGAEDFMKKPFTRAEVFRRIEPLLDAQYIPRRAKQRVGIPTELAAKPAESE